MYTSELSLFDVDLAEHFVHFGLLLLLEVALNLVQLLRVHFQLTEKCLQVSVTSEKTNKKHVTDMFSVIIVISLIN